MFSQDPSSQTRITTNPELVLLTRRGIIYCSHTLFQSSSHLDGYTTSVWIDSIHIVSVATIANALRGQEPLDMGKPPYLDPHKDMYDHIHKLHSQFFGNYQTDKIVERSSIHYERCLIVVDSGAFVRSLAL
ncbi:hypothetical protein M0R45_034921 [Rubus argutus]|uniref:Uncharacterized protein n=1 Tax=Rubus argutus TaxID=59490 RepID=A0AAW1VVA4_RUBAR